jgi:hypothetical protein
MVSRIAAWILLLVGATQLANLWPLPSEIAAQQIAFWAGLKAKWESTDPMKSENPDWTAKSKSESLSQIGEILANPDELLHQARFEWGLWLLSAALSLGAALAARRRSRYWPWLVASLVALLLWLQQPWRVLSMFLLEGEFDMNRGVHQIEFIEEHTGVAVAMILFNALASVVLTILAVYGVSQIVRGRENAL